MEKLAMGKHSSLLRKSVSYGSNKFYITGPSPQIVALLSIVIYYCNMLILKATAHLTKKCAILTLTSGTKES
jgi:hypothetical protein